MRLFVASSCEAVGVCLSGGSRVLLSVACKPGIVLLVTTQNNIVQEHMGENPYQLSVEERQQIGGRGGGDAFFRVETWVWARSSKERAGCVKGVL